MELAEVETDSDTKNDIEDVYRKLDINPQTESVKADGVQDSESCFGTNSYYWFK